MTLALLEVGEAATSWKCSVVAAAGRALAAAIPVPLIMMAVVAAPKIAVISLRIAVSCVVCR